MGILNEHGNIGERNKYIYGDIDVGVWVEKVKNPLDKKVIASTQYCSGAADNTHLYILSGFEHDFYVKFKCRTVWPRQNKKGGYRVVKSKKYPNGWFSWGDDRDIKTPSIQTYRERDFDFSYGDCRDKGSVFTLDNLKGGGPSIDHPHWREERIPYALKLLRWHFGALENYEQNKC